MAPSAALDTLFCLPACTARYYRLFTLHGGGMEGQRTRPGGRAGGRCGRMGAATMLDRTPFKATKVSRSYSSSMQMAFGERAMES